MEIKMPLQYFKSGGRYTGNKKNMRFLLVKQKASSEDDTDVLFAAVWRGPYRYDATPDELKSDRIFPLSEEGKQTAVEWLNEMYEEKKKIWEERVSIPDSAYLVPSS